MKVGREETFQSFIQFDTIIAVLYWCIRLEYPGLEVIICRKIILPGVFAHSDLDPGLALNAPLFSQFYPGLKSEYPGIKLTNTQAGNYPVLHTFLQIPGVDIS